MPAHPPARHPEPAQCPSRPPCSPSTRLGISKDHEVAASVHADTPNPGEPVTTEQQPHTPLPWTRTRQKFVYRSGGDGDDQPKLLGLAASLCSRQGQAWWAALDASCSMVVSGTAWKP